MLTAGVNAKKYFEWFGLFGSVYYQTGKNTLEQSKSAYQFSVNADFILSSKINLIIGTEWLSGKNYDTPVGENKSFSPLYGTNHAFNGFMDYFYYAGYHFNSFGLNDYYIKGSFKLHDNSLLITNLHAFTANGKLGKTDGEDLSSYLGSELDLALHQKIEQYITMYLGQSFMFGSESMEVIKEVSQPKGLQSWTWIGVKVAPSFRLK